MKTSIVSVLFLFIFFLPSSTFAHLPGQEPFFKINTLYTPLYPVFSTSREDFILPQDIAPEVYLVNTNITFEIDTKRLSMISEEALAKMQFIWDFGDGQTSKGFIQEHTYTHIGSYIVTVYADDKTTEPVLFQSTLLHIVPNKTYTLPKAIIMVNGAKSSDPLTQPLSFSFDDVFIFDAQKSFEGSAAISSYYWDFGDMQKGKKAKEKHTFKDDLRIIFPVLRIKDKNGFINDTFVQINNTLYDYPLQNDKTKSVPFSYIILSVLVFAVVIIIVIGFYITRAKRKKS